VAVSCEHGIDPSGSIKSGKVFDQMSDCQLLKEDSTLWSQLG